MRSNHAVQHFIDSLLLLCRKFRRDDIDTFKAFGDHATGSLALGIGGFNDDHFVLCYIGTVNSGADKQQSGNYQDNSNYFLEWFSTVNR